MAAVSRKRALNLLPEDGVDPVDLVLTVNRYEPNGHAPATGIWYYTGHYDRQLLR